MQNGFFYTIPTALAEGGDATKALLYGLVTNLARRTGECYASNGFLAERLNISERTVSRKVSELIKDGWLVADVDKKGGNKRFIRIMLGGGGTNCLDPIDKLSRPYRHQCLQTNINNNNNIQSANAQQSDEVLEEDEFEEEIEEEVEEITYEVDEDLKPYNPLKANKKPTKAESNAVVKLCGHFKAFAGIDGSVDVKPWLRPISSVYKHCDKDFQATIDFIRQSVDYFEEKGLSYTPHTLNKNKGLIEKWLAEAQKQENDKFNNVLYV